MGVIDGGHIFFDNEIAKRVAKKHPGAAAQHRALADRAVALAKLLEGSMADIRIGGPTTL